MKHFVVWRVARLGIAFGSIFYDRLLGLRGRLTLGSSTFSGAKGSWNL